MFCQSQHLAFAKWYLISFCSTEIYITAEDPARQKLSGSENLPSVLLTWRMQSRFALSPDSAHLPGLKVFRKGRLGDAREGVEDG